jgi:hypothetical protein
VIVDLKARLNPKDKIVAPPEIMLSLDRRESLCTLSQRSAHGMLLRWIEDARVRAIVFGLAWNAAWEFNVLKGTRVAQELEKSFKPARIGDYFVYTRSP